MKQIHLKVAVYIIGIFVVFTYGNSCGQSEYQSSAEECCPMCGPGLVVLQDCTNYRSTTCIPCVTGTYMNEPNGLHDCFACKTCDNGLFVLKECTTWMNTVCEVMEGYYCNEFSKGDCSHALPHRTCAPGQQIKSPGTTNSDVVCEDCPLGFYSPNGTICRQWTDCYVEGRVQDKDGSSVSDVQCKSKWRGRFGLISVAIWFLFSSIAVVLIKTKKSKAADMLRENVSGAGQIDPGEDANPSLGTRIIFNIPVEEVSGQCPSFPEENNEEG